MTARSLCIVSCTAKKRASPMPAEDLYSSPLFRLSRRYAQANYDRWAILSAKHGLISPSEIISPYDQELSTLSNEERRRLVRKVRNQAKAMMRGTEFKLTSICGEEYNSLLAAAGLEFERRRELELPIGKKLSALSEATDPNGSEKDLNAAYKIIRRLAAVQGYTRLRDRIGCSMPEAGIYLFFDEREHRIAKPDEGRIVRVGTHGVALGSRASLRNRMRTHFGTSSGAGNHRSSIFRLHVGRALIAAGLAPSVQSWGTGVTTADINRVEERTLEHAVSRYLGNLRVLLIFVPGTSDKANDRAYLEQNLIALLNRPGFSGGRFV